MAIKGQKVTCSTSGDVSRTKFPPSPLDKSTVLHKCGIVRISLEENNEEVKNVFVDENRSR